MRQPLSGDPRARGPEGRDTPAKLPGGAGDPPPPATRQHSCAPAGIASIGPPEGVAITPGVTRSVCGPWMTNLGPHAPEKSAVGEPHVPLVRETGADAMAARPPPGVGREREDWIENGTRTLLGVLKKRKWIGRDE